MSNGWMVPTSAIRSQGDSSVVPTYVQGEWTMVQSAALQAGDQVMGTLTSNIDEDGGGMPGGFGGPPSGGRPGGG